MHERVKNIQCVVLASGFSRRFGGDKLLYEIERNVCLIAKTISVYLQVFNELTVVVRPGNDALRAELGKHDAVNVLTNDRADKGLSQSIVAAVAASKPLPGDEFKGWLFALADMPFVNKETVRQIVNASEKNNITQPEYRGRSGHPVFIGQKFADELAQLEGDVGAKPLLQQHGDKVNKVTCHDPGVLIDIDRPGDLKKRAGIC